MGGADRTTMKSVLITGGSSGIGFAMSRHFARAGYHLLWVSLSESELIKAQAVLQTEFNATPIDHLALDLSAPGSAQAVYDWTSKNAWTVDVLVNNAGFGTHGFVSDIPMDRELAMIETNVLASYKLMRLYLAEMRKHDSGTIIQIASNSAFHPVARMATYAATKAFVHSLGRALQEELKLQGSKVRSITVCPSAISDTPFRNTGAMEKVRTFNGIATTTAEEVASDVWKAFSTGKDFMVTGSRMRTLYALRGVIPYSLQQWMVRRETDSA